MEFIFALPFLLLPLAMPYSAGCMAKNFGRNFWVWFWVAVPLPLIAHIILLCLADKTKRVQPVGNEELYDHLFTKNKRPGKTSFTENISCN